MGRVYLGEPTAPKLCGNNERVVGYIRYMSLLRSLVTRAQRLSQWLGQPIATPLSRFEQRLAQALIPVALTSDQLRHFDAAVVSWRQQPLDDSLPLVQRSALRRKSPTLAIALGLAGAISAAIVVEHRRRVTQSKLIFLRPLRA
jgi:hypothetical protein